MADLDQPRTRRPTRLLWYAVSADAFTTSAELAVLFARHAGLVLTVLFLFSGAFSRLLFRTSLRLTTLMGVDPADVVAGYRLIRLW